MLLICFLPGEGAGQKHDHIWFYGWNNSTDQPDFHGGRIDFNYAPPLATPDLRNVNMELYGHIMSDSTGENVLYYSQGRHIFHMGGQVMEGGNNINPGYWWDISHPGPYISSMSGLSIRYPGRENEYLYFHQRYDSLRTPPVCCLFPRDIYYSVIDMSANEGLGAVTSKGTVLTDAYNAGFGMTKTADNAGWWLVFGQHQSNIYHTYRVDSSGVHLHRFDTLGINIYENPEKVDQPGYSLFSPDGTMFARSDFWNGITVLSFDRCEGRLYNARFYPTEFRNTFTGLAFSPNSRFVYYNTSGQLIQLDTREEPEAYALDTIANWDRYHELDMLPFSDGFAFSELAPDGKIYISAIGSSRHLHVIERPNLPGQACGFRQHGFPLPTSNVATVPHFPNYRLEPIDCE
ncbi:hypothetical protein IX84_14200 [Phaeodactylibacter xiamenensis]|uniref:Uncharacterized protein n=2 Tax=Phaeodactylibacter xiamenensis TaxID=1524460 RepID=A0A098S6G1_9BACT|nr:hypothetical protein IX84_14200 [Phaeodactylibacter xiamenensis]